MFLEPELMFKLTPPDPFFRFASSSYPFSLVSGSEYTMEIVRERPVFSLVSPDFRSLLGQFASDERCKQVLDVPTFSFFFLSPQPFFFPDFSLPLLFRGERGVRPSQL